jgi:hypothetical protein
MSSRRPSPTRRTEVPAFRPRSSLAGPLAQLRRGKEALIEIDGQLDEVATWLKNPAAGLAADVPDRLARSARKAGDALAAVGLLHTSAADLY